MAILTKREFKQMNPAQLNEKLADLKKELMKIKTQISSGTTPENPGKVREVKKTIARILTFLKSKKSEKKQVKPVEEKKGIKKEKLKRTKEEKVKK